MAEIGAGKPRDRDGYAPEDLLQVRSTCLTVAATLGAHFDRLCIVGGLVPNLLIDEQFGPDPLTETPHPGTADLDVALEVALLGDRGYAEISGRLRREGFAPDINERGNPTPQRWKLAGAKVTVDFLMPPIDGGPDPARVQPLEPDFGALIIPGVELVPDERVLVDVDGYTLGGQRITREIPVCGPGAFIALKASAFAHRGEPKDVYDLIYVLRRWPDGIEDIARRLTAHAGRHEAFVRKALSDLSNDFRDPDHIGPRRAAEFDTLRAADLEAVAADAHGHVDDLLRSCAQAGLVARG